MSDTAAFFANKKKKKKAFKFNANLVDASTVTATVHVDAPALSTEQPEVEAPETAATTTSSNDATWDDQALATATTAASHRAEGGAVRDMKLSDTSAGTGSDNIAKKLRIQETKAQLAAAREGMEREALKLKEERERKEQGQAVKTASVSNTMGGRWLPPHLRAGGAASSTMFRSGRPGGKLDVQDEELFPDLAAADKILEQKEKETQPVKVPKKTPVGGGASWASKMKASSPTKVAAEPEAPKPAAPPEQPPPAEETKLPPTPVPASEAPKPVIKKSTVKKKKKDLSTFKPGGS